MKDLIPIFLVGAIIFVPALIIFFRGYEKKHIWRKFRG